MYILKSEVLYCIYILALKLLQSASIARSQGLLERKFLYKFHFLLGCKEAALWPTCLVNFDKNFLANLATKLLTHSVRV